MVLLSSSLLLIRSWWNTTVQIVVKYISSLFWITVVPLCAFPTLVLSFEILAVLLIMAEALPSALLRARIAEPSHSA